MRRNLILRTRATMIGLASVLMLGASIAPTASAASTPPGSEQSEVVFSMVGDLPKVGADGRLMPTQFRELGMTQQQVDEIESGLAPTTSAPEGSLIGEGSGGRYGPPPSSGLTTQADYTIVRGGEWKDVDGRDVVMRRTAYDKILTKHNLTMRVARAISQRPGEHYLAENTTTKYIYRLRVNEIVCRGVYGCYPRNTLVTQEAIDYRQLANGAGRYGVVTAYCEGYDGACPDYVKNAANL